ncbi:MAG TPA: glycosyltransferase family 4 protein [Gaiellaceae bacterium]|nr:glycosyltransferase family 4 protein [Gaiellaceae bacterium]
MSAPTLSFCFVTTFYPPYHFGGEALYLYRLSNQLARRGHRVTIVHCADSFELLTKSGPRGEYPHHPNVTVHAIRTGYGGLSPLVTYLSGRPGLKTRVLDDIFAGERFDVVHFHQMTLFGPDALRYGDDAVRLYTTHDHWLLCPMYDLWKFNRELCEEPACVRCQLSFKRPPQLWRWTNLLERRLPNVDLFLSPSRATIEQHRRRGFSYPMRHLPYFFPLDDTGPVPPAAEADATALAGSRPYFLFVGRLVKIKGLHTLFDTFRRYDGADLIVAGDGAWGDELRRQAADVPNVRFLGHVHPDVLRGLYAGAIATLVPSLVYETFGFITLESLAQGTPVVARDLAAVGELVEESGGGFTYTDDAGLLAALETLQTDRALRDELGARGHAAYVERWSEEPHLQRYLALIEEARGASLPLEHAPVVS